MSRFAIAFVEEQGQPVASPTWLTKVRTDTKYRDDGVQWQVTNDPDQATTWAKATTAADWIRRMESRFYTLEVVPAPTSEDTTAPVETGVLSTDTEVKFLVQEWSTFSSQWCDASEAHSHEQDAVDQRNRWEEQNSESTFRVLKKTIHTVVEVA